jgi:hypothetical protein
MPIARHRVRCAQSELPVANMHLLPAKILICSRGEKYLYSTLYRELLVRTNHEATAAVDSIEYRRCLPPKARERQ